MTSQRGATRVELAVLVVGAVAVVVSVLVYLRLGGDAKPAPTAGAGPTPAPAAPSSMPARGVLVESTVSASGEVQVRAWIRSSHPLTVLTVAVTDPDPTDGTASGRNLVVQASDGTVLGRQAGLGAAPVRVALGKGASDLYLTYLIEDGVASATPSAAGSTPDRMLANVLALDADYQDVAGPVVHVIRGPGRVLNVGCRRPSEGPSAPSFPCGGPEGTGWVVLLHGIDRDDQLIASLATY